MKKLFFIILFLFCFNAFAVAKQEVQFPKPVVVSLYSKNCEECEQLNIIKEGAKEAFGENVDFVDIDFDDEDCDFYNFKLRYNINKAPTTMFINSKYKITKKNTGYIPPKTFLKQLEAIMVE